MTAAPGDRRHARATLPRPFRQCCGKCEVTSARSTPSGCREQGGDLHGRLDLTCSVILRRTDLQDRLVRLTVAWTELDATTLPDGEADLDHLGFSRFTVPPFASGGVPKPYVVFFSESVSSDQIALAQEHLEAPDATLVFRLYHAAASQSGDQPRPDATIYRLCEGALSFLP
jgi:hypothetical protein